MSRSSRIRSGVASCASSAPPEATDSAGRWLRSYRLASTIVSLSSPCVRPGAHASPRRVQGSAHQREQETHGIHFTQASLSRART